MTNSQIFWGFALKPIWGFQSRPPNSKAEIPNLDLKARLETSDSHPASSGCFSACMDVQFPTLSWITQSGLALRLVLSRVSGVLWHSSGWVHWFNHVLQYMSGLEVLACSNNTNFNYAIIKFWLHLSFPLCLMPLQQ